MAEATAVTKCGDLGEWPARKARVAVQERKRRGGGPDGRGPKKEDTTLHHWTDGDWRTKSGGESERTGERHLPRVVRMLLSEDDHARTTRRKRGAKEQAVDQSQDIREKVSRVRTDGPSKAMLEERAAELGVQGRGSMDRDPLPMAIEAATDENARAKRGAGALRARNEVDLPGMAKERRGEGLSRTSKDDLAPALGG